MLSSPAKRRKTSATTSAAVDDRNGNSDHVSKPTTPRRASYLSPTKASLARSHPHLAQSNERRIRTEPRGRNLIDDLLKVKSAGHPSRSTDTKPKSPSPRSAPVAPRTERRAPLQSRQPPAPDVAAQDLIQPPVVPKLVSRFEGSTPARDPSPPGRNQPSLPPTPVDLGWEDPPERPRGLSSSSPRGSRSGSGRHRHRLQHHNQAVPSSPLKPKHPPPATVSLHDRESEADMAEEEVHVENGLPQEEPPELRQQRDELRRLRDRLYVLKESTAKLERAVNTNASVDNLLDDEAVSATLTARMKSRSAHNASFEQLIATDGEANKYLDLFAPGGLQLTVESSTEEKEEGHARVVYHVTASAPLPWPTSVFSVSLDVVTNADTATVEHVLWTGTWPGESQAVGITTELLDWINACLRSDFHGRNVGILLWGLGQYFDKAVQRAKAFWHLTAKYRRGNDAEADGLADNNEAEESDRGEEALGQDHVLKLVRYLGKTQLTIDLPQEDVPSAEEDRVPTKTAQPKLMIIWNIDLSWTGVAKNRCNIVPSGIPDGAVPAVKELFARLAAVQGFQQSFDAVYELVSRTYKKDATPLAKANENDPAVRVRARKRKKRLT
ncbi:hypothetical protein DV737_g937, partial [Chaetothyriales sp. CBS 132003]